jgi:hypothetical protein
MAEINIDRIGGSGGTPLPLGNLKVDNPLNPALQIVKDTGGNASALLISTTEVTNRGGGAIITNTAFGIGALITNTSGSSNTSIGVASLNINTTGVQNTALGVQSLSNNVSGSENTAIGVGSLRSIASTSNNTAVGSDALYDSTGSDNTAIGYNTGRGITTGSNNTILGANVTGLSSTLANNIIIADGSGNRRINVDSSGNVGIGTNAPLSPLNVYNSSASVSSLVLVEQDTAATAGQINQYRKNGSVNLVSGAEIGRLSFGGYFNSTYSPFSQVCSAITAYYGGTGTDRVGGLRLITWNGGGAITRLQVAPDGKIGIGTTGATAKFQILGEGTTSATTSLLVQNSAGAQNFKVADNGSVQIGTFNFVSSTVIENTTTRLVATTGGVAVNSSYAFANSSSILDVASTTKGFLPPRMTTAQKLAIVTPAAGLMVYDTDLNKLCLYTTAWEIITSA